MSECWSCGPSPDTGFLYTPTRHTPCCAQRRTHPAYPPRRIVGTGRSETRRRFWSETEEHSLEVVAGSLHEIDTEIKGGVPPAFVPSAKDVTEITPELARVVHEDPHVRVLDLRGEPRQQFPFHFHQARVTIRLGSARMSFVEQNGTTRITDFHPGEATWGDAVEHSDAVVSGSFHLVLVEIKGQPASPGNSK